MDSRQIIQLYVALMLITLIFIGFFFALIRMLVVQKRTQQARLEQLINEKMKREREIEETWLRRVSEEMHDGFLQDLIALRYKISGLKLQREQGELDLSAVDESLEFIKHLIHYMNSLTGYVNASFNERSELLFLVQQESGTLEKQYGLLVELDVDNYNDALSIPGHTQILLFRFIREALRNVVRHAGVGQCLVRLVNNDQITSVEVDDFGRGMDREQKYHKAAGAGIPHMKRIADYLGGKFHIKSEPDEGTTIQLFIHRHSEAIIA